MSESSGYTVIDLLDIRESLGAHWSTREKDGYAAPCSRCSEQVTQCQDRCEYCELPVVWKHSRVWTRLYGRPHLVEKRLLSTPVDTLGKQLCERAGVQRFATPYTLRRWKSARKHLDERTIEGIVDHCVASLERRNQGLRGLISFVLNTTDQRVRALPKEEPDEEAGELVIEIYGE